MKKNIILLPIFLLVLTGCGASLKDAQNSATTFFDNVNSGASFEYHIEDTNGNSQDVLRDGNGNIKVTYSGGEVDYIINGQLTVCVDNACEESTEVVDTESIIQGVIDSVTDSISGEYQASAEKTDNGVAVKMSLTDFSNTDEVIGEGTFTFNSDGTSIDYNFDCTQDEESFTCFDYKESALLKDVEEIVLPS